MLFLTAIISIAAPADKRVKVRLSTNMGDMVVELYNEKPKHRYNFIKLVK